MDYKRKGVRWVPNRLYNIYMADKASKKGTYKNMYNIQTLIKEECSDTNTTFSSFLFMN